jgi:hypothetical protein
VKAPFIEEEALKLFRRLHTEDLRTWMAALISISWATPCECAAGAKREIIALRKGLQEAESERDIAHARVKRLETELVYVRGATEAIGWAREALGLKPRESLKGALEAIKDRLTTFDATEAKVKELEAQIEALNHLDCETEEEHRAWKARAEVTEAEISRIVRILMPDKLGWMPGAVAPMVEKLVAECDAAQAKVKELEARLLEVGTEREADGRQYLEVLKRCEVAKSEVSRIALILAPNLPGWTPGTMAPAVEKLVAERDAALARLAAIDKAREGEPPEPKLGQDGAENSYALAQAALAWGRAGWDASAALRAELHDRHELMRNALYMLSETPWETLAEYAAKYLVDNRNIGMERQLNADLRARLARYEQFEGEVEEVPEFIDPDFSPHDYCVRLRSRLVGALADRSLGSQDAIVTCLSKRLLLSSRRLTAWIEPHPNSQQKGITMQHFFAPLSITIAILGAIFLCGAYLPTAIYHLWLKRFSNFQLKPDKSGYNHPSKWNDFVFDPRLPQAALIQVQWHWYWFPGIWDRAFGRGPRFLWKSAFWMPSRYANAFSLGIGPLFIVWRRPWLAGPAAFELERLERIEIYKQTHPGPRA